VWYEHWQEKEHGRLEASHVASGREEAMQECREKSMWYGEILQGGRRNWPAVLCNSRQNRSKECWRQYMNMEGEEA
jgi:hypothetical protein